MAQRSRIKKKEELFNLEKYLVDLSEENAALKTEVLKYKNELLHSKGAIRREASPCQVPVCSPALTLSARSMLEFDIELPDQVVAIVNTLLHPEEVEQLVLGSPQADGDRDCASFTAKSDEGLTSSSSLFGLNPHAHAICVINSLSEEFSVMYASPGFAALTGYRKEQIIGHNCGAFLQGPQTDPKEVRLSYIYLS